MVEMANRTNPTQTWQTQRSEAQQHSEGPVARTIEQQTAKLPSDLFLWASLGSMALSLGLYMTGRKHDSMFFGQWAPSLLIMGLYNKIVKVAGSDRIHSGTSNSF